MTYKKMVVFAQSVVKGALDQVLLGLNFLHEANVIHTGKFAPSA